MTLLYLFSSKCLLHSAFYIVYWQRNSWTNDKPSDCKVLVSFSNESKENFLTHYYEFFIASFFQENDQEFRALNTGMTKHWHLIQNNSCKLPMRPNLGIRTSIIRSLNVETQCNIKSTFLKTLYKLCFHISCSHLSCTVSTQLNKLAFMMNLTQLVMLELGILFRPVICQ